MRVKISDVLWFQEGPGVRNTQYTDSGVKLLNVANLVDGKVDISNTSRYISEEEAYGKYEHFLVDEGDFIIASSGIKVEYFDKKMGFVSSEQLPLCMNTSTIRFKVLDKDSLDIRYFMYYLKSDEFKDQLAHQITGSAQLNFGPSHLKKMDMPLAGICEQKQIVSKLDFVESLIQNRRSQLSKLDELIKSRFVELFGDPIGESRYELVPIAKLGTVGTGSTPSMRVAEYYKTADIPFVKPGDFADNGVTRIKDETSFVSEEARGAARIMPCDTVMVTCIGTIGKVGIASHECACNQQINFIIPVPSINSVYLAYCLSFYKTVLVEMANAPVVPIINKSQFSTVTLPVPPLEKQEQFAAFVEQTDKSKLAIQQSLEKFETLKKALMQKYFG